MEGDIIMVIKVNISVVISLCYCYWIGRSISAGTRRLLFLAPIICFFLFIPFNFSSVHLRGNTGFFFAWLGTFKLILFAFNKGPLSSDPSISLGRFVASASLPIKIQQNQPHIRSKTSQDGKTPPPPDPSKHSKSSHFVTNPSSETPKTNGQSKEKTSPTNPSKGHTPLIPYAIKAILLASLVKLYDYSDQIHPKVIFGMYCFHIYFMLELLLATFAALARTMGMELEPQFNNPLLSTSLQDFWGRRWNLMVTSILRPAVYQPSLKATMNVVGPSWAPLPAVFATFVVSGIMHELILYYMGRMPPTLRMMEFFVLHGLCLMVEIVLKKTLGSTRRLPRLVSGLLTFGFVSATSFWLFLPEFVRCHIDVMAFEDYAALGAFLKNLSAAF
ncbi:hypothetical protein HN51_034859 [Arachis hypogaea]|uniref:Wax synthase domain-containing protein n=1 Tax=Arachis hypogaea TaxID=3818 RepID=A0A445A734_ARAHY|nr:acyl-CoA--sterol O-acyltransferase 1-like [Arachis ipaensis]XP_025642946.1 acyl-CoA--sterol O-acyltransferase 1-like [Arachis hypogaea]RYR22219.1 hypothetical protein Ahy_B03g067493 [Arachis hypogaea]